MKPILFLFNHEMVRAILNGRKTVTRRVVKPQPPEGFIQAQDVSGAWFFNDKLGDNDMMTWWPSYEKGIVPPYRPGDILYVRETWNSITFGNGNTAPFRTEYWYKADDTSHNPDDKWRPSIHMPRKAARIFLRVTDVRAEKLQDINERGPRSAEAEGCVNDIDLVNGGGKSATKHFSDLWDSVLKPTDHALYGWDANPWVWVIEFERISREEAYHGMDTP